MALSILGADIPSAGWIGTGGAGHETRVGQSAARGGAALHDALDDILDLYVRDGLVYYRALDSDRGKLDRYLVAIGAAGAAVAGWDRDRQAAYWLNAYNALVLRTVVDHYPIRGRRPEYPAGSIRQIPGAFERTTWRAGGRTVTLDDIEKTHLAAFKDPRMYFAIGRGALGGGRLRSEAFDPATLEQQLTDVAADCVKRVTCADVAETTNTLSVSPIFGWREADFVAAYAGAAGDRYASRSPMERAVVAFLEPHLYTSERAWLAANAFVMRFHEFDWRLNDLTGRGVR